MQSYFCKHVMQQSILQHLQQPESTSHSQHGVYARSGSADWSQSSVANAPLMSKVFGPHT